MADYIDRGIMKWQPFDALAGYHELIKEMLYIKHKKEKPVLFEDKLEEINRLMAVAIKEKAAIKVAYFKDGYLWYQTGEIVKIDLTHAVLTLSSHIKIDLADIVDVEMTEVIYDSN